jgi:hypothetical protein
MYKRFFLNKDRGTAFCEIDSTKEHGGYFDADVAIGDCNRQVRLDFGFDSSNRKQRKERLKKLENLIVALEELYNEMSQ